MFDDFDTQVTPEEIMDVLDDFLEINDEYCNCYEKENLKN